MFKFFSLHNFPGETPKHHLLLWSRFALPSTSARKVVSLGSVSTRIASDSLGCFFVWLCFYFRLQWRWNERINTTPIKLKQPTNNEYIVDINGNCLLCHSILCFISLGVLIPINFYPRRPLQCIILNEFYCQFDHIHKPIHKPKKKKKATSN